MAVMFSAVFMPHVEAALEAAGLTNLQTQWDLPNGLYPVKGDLLTDHHIGSYQFIVVERILAFDQNYDMTFQLLLDSAPARGKMPVDRGANGAGTVSTRLSLVEPSPLRN